MTELVSYQVSRQVYERRERDHKRNRDQPQFYERRGEDESAHDKVQLIEQRRGLPARNVRLPLDKRAYHVADHRSQGDHKHGDNRVRWQDNPSSSSYWANIRVPSHVLPFPSRGRPRNLPPPSTGFFPRARGAEEFAKYAGRMSHRPISRSTTRDIEEDLRVSL